jgi:signal peptidase I
MAESGVPLSPQQVESPAGAAAFNGANTTTAAPVAVAPPSKPRTGATTEHKDGAREIVETVVFVVVLVLLLKSFVAEAFVIPTGSMAETLLGYQKVVDCPKCRYTFPVNCSKEVDPQDGPLIKTLSATCPNCRHDIHFASESDPPASSGDRVLVAKFLYDLLQRLPDRHDVVVFKYPQAPQKGTIPTNYIKRLVGLPGETIAIHYGDLYCRTGLTYEGRRQPEREQDRWDRAYTYENDPEAMKLYADADGGFRIIRKEPGVMLSMRRIVYDNDFQNPDRPRRWEPHGNGWTAGDSSQPGRLTGDPAGRSDIAWLRYRHVLDQGGKRELITDFMGYNTYQGTTAQNWVGDLMLECEVTPDQDTGELILELSRGVDRFQLRFDLASGTCALERLHNGAPEKLASKQVALKKGTKHLIRFANFDERLTLWVNNSMPFDDGVIYSSGEKRSPTENDLEPASIGIRGGKFMVARLKLWRDTYYTVDNSRSDGGHHVSWSDPDTWNPLASLPVKTLYVQPGHFLCMGDNSPESSDGRSWGLVPQRLMLGRALAVYYPFYFPYWPLNSRANRIGAIK